MRPDFIRIIEAIYAEGREDRDWLRGILAAAEPALDLGLGIMAYTFTADPRIGPIVHEGAASGAFGGTLLKTARQMTAEQGVRALRGFHSQVSLLSAITSRAFVDSYYRHVDVGEATDVVGVVGTDPSAQGMVLAALAPRGFQLTPAFRRPWRCVTSHLATGRRLRAHSAHAADEAVLDLAGKLHDAVGKATSRDAQEALRHAARCIDRARARRTRPPAAALEGWQALVSARWSLVDRFESDGRTFLIAKPNPPRPPALRRLTPQERAVVALAALGRSNKLIAYELGLSTGSVATYLLRAQRRLGVTSRAALVQTFLSASEGAVPQTPPALSPPSSRESGA